MKQNEKSQTRDGRQKKPGEGGRAEAAKSSPNENSTIKANHTTGVNNQNNHFSKEKLITLLIAEGTMRANPRAEKKRAREGIWARKKREQSSLVELQPPRRLTDLGKGKNGNGSTAEEENLGKKIASVESINSGKEKPR